MKLREHASGLGRWQAVQRPADTRLRAYVHGYFASSSLLNGVVTERHLPSAEVPLILNFGAAHLRMERAGASGWARRDGTWVAGLHQGPVLCGATGERHFMVVRFTPVGAHLFLRTPMDQMTNEAVDLAQIDLKLAQAIRARVDRGANWAERFDAMEQFIAERVLGGDPGAMGWAWRKLASADGRVPLGRLASEVDITHRHLIAQFRTFVGLPPRTAARMLRFSRVVRSLNGLSHTRRGEPAGKPYIEARDVQEYHGPAIAWADIAADCGYADQAHLIKEFRAFAGTTPSRFLRTVVDEG